MEGTVITKNGKALLAKLISAQGALRFTRVAAGAGIHQGEYDPESMEELLDYKMDGILSKCETTEDMAVLTVQIMSPNLETGFLATELGIFAKEDTDEAEEMLYAYLDMHEDPQYIYANGSSTQKIIEITLEVVIANTAQVKAEIAPDSIVFREEFEEVKESLDQTKVTEQDLRELIGEETVRAKNAETKNAEDIKTAHENSKAEIDKKIADLIGGAPETLDTLKEVADAIKENESVTDALNQSIGQKANAEDFNELNKNALLKTGDTKDNTTLFVSRDRLNPTEWTDVDTLKSEEKHSSIFEKISTMVKNVRYLYKMLGSTDISAIGNGTVTGAINSLNTETQWKKLANWSRLTIPSTPYTTVESAIYNELKTAKQCIVELQGTDLGNSLFIPSPGVWIGYSNGAADAYILTPKATFNNTGKIYLSAARIGESATLAYVSSVYYR